MASGTNTPAYSGQEICSGSDLSPIRLTHNQNTKDVIFAASTATKTGTNVIIMDRR